MSIARSYRFARAAGAAFFLFAGIVALWWMGRQGPPERVPASGVIEEVFDTGIVGDAHRLARVRLDDGREARVAIPTYALATGGSVPLLIEVYADGDEAVLFDPEAWADADGS